MKNKIIYYLFIIDLFSDEQQQKQVINRIL